MRCGRAAGGRLLLLCAVGCLVAVSFGLCRVPAAYASSKADRALGATVFHEKGCEHCHGVDGIGTERGPELSGVGRILHPAQIALQIREGGKEMPAFGEALSSDEIQQLVTFLGSKKKKQSVPHSKAN